MAIKNIVALVPMRHHSVRVAGKNYRDLAGQPLYAYIINTLLEVKEISKIVVDTDSQKIKKGLDENFPDVVVIDRPEHLRDGNIPMNEILLHDVSMVEADLYLQTHSTNPILSSDTISKAITFIKNHYPEYDSLFSATKVQVRLWDELVRPINHNPNILLRTQDLPPVYAENSCMYVFSKRLLEEKRNRIGDRPYLFEIDQEEAWDIDNELDFKIVDLLIRNRSK